jgi:glycosyltransferase involved in cell wall biosynthesis
VFVWHVHGSWMTAFVRGRHRYLVPVVTDRGPDGRGRARTYSWPDSVEEVTPEEAAQCDVDVIVLQRLREFELAERWLRRRPGRDLPAIYVEHNTPRGGIDDMVHPCADRGDLTLVQVTHFNRLFWDSGRTRTRVIEHGIVDPGPRYSGELARGAAVINEARRRGRVTGTDLLLRLGGAVPVDLFGIDAAALGGIEDLPQNALHDAMARRRFYVHLNRWTSLGLSLLEAMQLGMPVIALATTEVPEAVPAAAGFVSNQVERLQAAAALLCAEPELACEMGRAARAAALDRYGLSRFLSSWDTLLAEVA